MGIEGHVWGNDLGIHRERELVWFRHAYSRLSEVARDLGFYAAGLKGLKECPVAGFLGSLIS